MFNNVQFTRLSDNLTKNTQDDFGLLLSPFELEIPSVQTNYISIAGKDGEIDLTEVLGQINYNNRKLTLTFTSPNGMKNTFRIYQQISNFIHGQRVKIVLPNLEDYYLIGRCTLNNFQRAKNTEQIIINANCEPYFYKRIVTTVTKTIGDIPYEVTINNLKMPTVPTISTTDNVVMNFENTDYSFNSQHFINTSIVLKEGKNIFTFKNGSSGTVTFTYQEGML